MRPGCSTVHLQAWWGCGGGCGDGGNHQKQLRGGALCQYSKCGVCGGCGCGFLKCSRFISLWAFDYFIIVCFAIYNSDLYFLKY